MHAKCGCGGGGVFMCCSLQYGFMSHLSALHIIVGATQTQHLPTTAVNVCCFPAAYPSRPGNGRATEFANTLKFMPV